MPTNDNAMTTPTLTAYLAARKAGTVCPACGVVGIMSDESLSPNETSQPPTCVLVLCTKCGAVHANGRHLTRDERLWLGKNFSPPRMANFLRMQDEICKNMVG